MEAQNSSSSILKTGRTSLGCLIVEDDLQLQSGLKDLLSMEGYLVRTASNGREALNILESYDDIQVVVCDIKMPEMSGLAFTQELRNRKIKIPVIFCSGYADKDSAIEAIRLGAFDFLEKPVRSQQMLDAIERALQSDLIDIKHRLNKLNLTSLQADILELVMKGLPNSKIGELVHLAEPTVKYHVGNLLKRFGVKRRGDLRAHIRRMI